MPNVKLVFSRDKFMRTANDPKYRQIALTAFNRLNRSGNITASLFKRLRELYPIDHVVIDYRYRKREGPVRMLRELGWKKVGRSGPYEVWKAP